MPDVWLKVSSLQGLERQISLTHGNISLAAQQRALNGMPCVQGTRRCNPAFVTCAVAGNFSSHLWSCTVAGNLS